MSPPWPCPRRPFSTTLMSIVVQADKAVKRPVTLGLQNTTVVEVLTGLSEGDVVIVEGNYGLGDGAPVRIAER